MKGYLTLDQKIAILNELGVYDKWKTNIINLKSEIHMNYVLSDKCRFSKFINRSFSWSQTKEGDYFWREIYENAIRKEEKELNPNREDKIRIMKEAQIYSKWKINRIKQCGKDSVDEKLDSLEYNSVSRFIGCTISWRDTKEGISFWRKKEEEIEKIENSEENQYDQRRKN